MSETYKVRLLCMFRVSLTAAYNAPMNFALQRSISSQIVKYLTNMYTSLNLRHATATVRQTYLLLIYILGALFSHFVLIHEKTTKVVDFEEE